MSRSRAAYALAAAVVVAGLAFLFSRGPVNVYLPAPGVAPSLVPQEAAAVPGPLVSGTLLSPGKELSSDSRLPLTDDARAEVRECLGAAPGESSESAEDVLAWVATGLGPERESREHSRNLHLVLPGGELRRLRLFDDDRGESRPRRRLQWFSEDAEGLPVPLRIPPSEAADPSDEAIARYLSQGRVVFEERASTVEWARGSAEIIRRNGRIAELHVRAGKRVSLGCAANATSDAMGCRCLSRR